MVYIKKILGGQRFSIYSRLQFPECDLVQLKKNGFSADPFERDPTIVLLEDRDRHAVGNRSERFHKGLLATALREANGLLLVVFQSKSERWRLGGERQIDAHWMAVASLVAAGGLTVVVRTTSDRVRFWIEEGHSRGRGRYAPMWLDGQGVNVTRAWRVAA